LGKGQTATDSVWFVTDCPAGNRPGRTGAVADGILTEAEDPAAHVPKPRRLRSTRRALPDSRLDELFQVAASTGNDPALDTLIPRLHVETACRRGGALALIPEDLDPEQCLVRLREKGGLPEVIVSPGGDRPSVGVPQQAPGGVQSTAVFPVREQV
jgi:integrase